MNKSQETQEELLLFEKALYETFQILLRFEEKANSMFTKLIQQSKYSSLCFEKEDLYAVYIAGERRIVPLPYVNDTLRKDKASVVSLK